MSRNLGFPMFATRSSDPKDFPFPSDGRKRKLPFHGDFFGAPSDFWDYCYWNLCQSFGSPKFGKFPKSTSEMVDLMICSRDAMDFLGWDPFMLRHAPKNNHEELQLDDGDATIPVKQPRRTHTCCLHMDHTITVGVSLCANASSFLAKRRVSNDDWRW